MTRALINGCVLTPEGLRDNWAVILEGERIASVCEMHEAPKAAETIDLQGGVLAPGFIDIQVNGGAGVLFNDNPSVEAIKAIGAAHRTFGTTGFLPTLISDDLDILARAIAAVRTAIEQRIPG